MCRSISHCLFLAQSLLCPNDTISCQLHCWLAKSPSLSLTARTTLAAASIGTVQSASVQQQHCDGSNDDDQDVRDCANYRFELVVFRVAVVSIKSSSLGLVDGRAGAVVAGQRGTMIDTAVTNFSQVFCTGWRNFGIMFFKWRIGNYYYRFTALYLTLYSVLI